MSTYTPKVGDVVHRPNSYNRLTVTAVGRDYFLATSEHGCESSYLLGTTELSWVKVEPTPADRYAIVATNGHVFPHSFASVEEASRSVMYSDRVARFSFAEWVVPGE